MANIKDQKQQQLNELYTTYKKSKKLHVKGGSTHIVFGEGNPDAKIMFIGEAPGAEEDRQGKPFVGRSGQLLNKILEAAEVPRNQVFITNIVKVRPPNNRKPTPTEMQQARDLLFKQIDIIQPKVICTLGASALEGLLNHPVAISKVRGKFIPLNDLYILPTYHPAFILRNPNQIEPLTKDIFKACNAAYATK